jgi:hypothetical protein
MLGNIFKNKFTKIKINPLINHFNFSYYYLTNNIITNNFQNFSNKNKNNNNNNNKTKENYNKYKNTENENLKKYEIPRENLKNKFNIKDLLKILPFLLLISFNENKKIFCFKATNKELERASNTIENDIKNLEFKYGGTLKREPIK